MKTKILLSFLLTLAVSLGVALFATAGTPFGTAFSYQGRLTYTNGPATGLYDLRFALYTNSTLGGQVGATITTNGMPVTNGLLTISLELGPVFDGTAYWLEIGAKTNGAASFLTLPRQPLTPSPNALYAATAKTANAVASNAVTADGIQDATITASKLAGDIGVWNKSSANVSYSGGNVGLGTANPEYRLTLKGSGNEVYSVMSEDGTQIPDNLTFQIAPGGGGSSTRIGYLMGNFGSSEGFLVANNRSAPLRFGTANAERMRIDASGKVGINKPDPATALDVNGTVTATAFAGSGAGLTGVLSTPADNSVTSTKLAFDAASLNKVSGGTVTSSGGNVGIGTASPNTPLTIQGKGDNAEWLQFKGTNGANKWHLNSLGSGLNFAESGVADGRLFLAPGGNVGVGTSVPQTKLDVRGDVKLGINGQYFATSGQENLRIIRGGVNLDGSIWTGTGFTVTHISTGIYTINFAQSFSGYHTTTATALDGGPTFVTQFTANFGDVTFNVWRNGIKADVAFDFISIGPK